MSVEYSYNGLRMEQPLLAKGICKLQKKIVDMG